MNRPRKRKPKRARSARANGLVPEIPQRIFQVHSDKSKWSDDLKALADTLIQPRPGTPRESSPALKFRRPIAKPSDEFAPLLDKALQGELNQLLEFWELYGWIQAPELEPAFCECLGLLATSSLPKQRSIAAKIVRLSQESTTRRFWERGGPYWKQAAEPLALKLVHNLHSVAKEASEWIERRRAAQKKGATVYKFLEKIPTCQLWEEYLREKGSGRDSSGEATEMSEAAGVVLYDC